MILDSTDGSTEAECAMRVVSASESGMSDLGGDEPQWKLPDAGWGRKAADAATLHEPQNIREYVAMHQHLKVGNGTRLLDVACGAGLAVELATARGATAAGIDASPRLVAVARDRSPGADLRVGDMRALPWADDAFDVVTSFRGIWGTTPEVLDEVRRVLRPGGLLGLTVWGHVKASPGAWALRPFRWAESSQVAHQAAMNSLGKPGVGEQLLTRHGFEAVRRVDVPFVWEFADPESFARALACTGPGYEAIQTIGEERFRCDAAQLAAAYARDGLPLRAEINLVGFVARVPAVVGAGSSFLAEPEELTPAASASYADDSAELGYVMNATRMWAHDTEALELVFKALGRVTKTAELSRRDRGILVTAAASALGDSYCSLAWGTKLAAAASAQLSAGVLAGDDSLLADRERALARWARLVAADPNSTAVADVQPLREAGYGEAQILAITAYVALRVAFSSVNDALGAVPDWQLRSSTPEAVLEAVTFGRAPAPAPTPVAGPGSS
ncbi:methyltransferase domain-containing protein [Micromonospora sp. PLK6-60]|uniref:methyltransferase domain-containing protein n=1 Tax=Micromonospora sp. PLK6-60 TaxID=2873383 RepID=UPI001CA6CECE|nr:methyltransferase domain-containing protein [Micromonospora sp. PLK6-60]MBY8872468.1 methyltransferase domain-containing protein [Micromonospora sp. PLK6-60]